MALETVSFVGDLNPANPPGTDPKSQGDDHLRGIKTGLKNSFPGMAGAIIADGVDGGPVNAYTVTPATPLIAYTPGMFVIFSPSATNTGASTINVSALGATPLRQVHGAETVAGDLVAGCQYVAQRNGTEFRLLGPTKNYIDQLAFSPSLPAKPAGNVPQVLKTQSNVASWGGIPLPRTTRTANALLTAADGGTLVAITSGTFTQTFDACANLRNGWMLMLHNQGTGDITLTPNGAELIDGLASYVMYPGESRLFTCDGLTLTSNVLQPFNKKYIASGTFVRPPGYSYFDGIATSAGASGSALLSQNNTPVLSGAGGGSFPFQIAFQQLAASTAITVGVGGASVSSTGANTLGNPGGDTSIGALIVVKGATTTVGGAILLSQGGGGDGFGSPSTGPGAISAVWGGSVASNTGSVGANSLYGGAAGGSLAQISAAVTAGGTSTFAGNGGASAIASANAQPGIAPGGGGGAVLGTGLSGAGARGECVIRGRV